MTRHTPPKKRRYSADRAVDGWRLIDPDPARARATLDRLGPVGDQLEAALGDQLGLLRGAYQADVHNIPALPSWAAAALVRWAASRRQCGHLGAAGPQPRWLHAWDPTLRCTACMTAAEAQIVGTDENTTCDGCRSHVDTIWPAAMTAGNLTVVGGLCGGCNRRTRAEGAA